MARNDIYVNVNATSPADCIVVGQQDMTAADIPELVLGDTPTFNFYFTDNTNVWPSWAGNAAYTVTWALSDAVSGDFAPAATTGNATPITGGWAITLPLNSYDLVGLLNTKRVSQPYPVTNLWQQLRVTDPSGNEVTRALVYTPIRYRAISDTQNTQSASPTGGRFVTVSNTNALETPSAAGFYAANPVPASALPLGLGTDTAPANGELLIGNGTGYQTSTLTAGTGVSITNGPGSITIDATNAQEILTATVKNAEASPITKGQVVYLFSATGNMPSVKLAYNTTDATSAKTFGVVSDASIAPNGTGTVTCVGVVDGLMLGSYTDGDTVYLGATPGSITATKPYAPNHLVYVGIVERANNGNGELYVRIQNGYELDEIHDVQINAPTLAGQTLIYDNTLSLWKNARLTGTANQITVTNADAAITLSIPTNPTLPGNLTVSGTGTSTFGGNLTVSGGLLTLNNATESYVELKVGGTTKGYVDQLSSVLNILGMSGVDVDIYAGGNNPANRVAKFAASGIATTLYGNLTVSGTGTFGGTSTLTGGYWKTKPTADDGTLTGLSLANSSGAQVGVVDVNTLTGDIRVGGTNSSYPLALYSKSVAVMTFGASSAATLAGNLTVSGSDIRISGNTGYFYAGNPATLNGMVIEAASNQVSIYSNNAQNFILKSNGNVLVGTTTDGGFKLDVNGTARIQSNLTVSGTGTSSFAGKLIAGSATADYAVSKLQSNGALVVYGGAITNAPDAPSIVIDQQVGGVARIMASGTSTWAVPLCLNPYGGNVLLGTTTDGGQKLQVAGSTEISGSGQANAKLGITNTLATSYSQLVLSSSSGQSSTLYQFGSSYTTSGRYVQGSLLIEAAGTGGLGLATSAAAPITLYTNGTTALTLDSSQNATFAGRVGIGGASVAASSLILRGASLTSGTTQLGLDQQTTFSSGATNAGRGVSSIVVTAAASFTMANGAAFYALTPIVGAGSAITTSSGFYVANQGGTGITNAYGIDIAAQSGASTVNVGLRNLGATILATPATAVTLNDNSSMTFELTSNTSLTIKVRGTDGTTRSVALTLA